jgi:Flp pilus assembly pilin Flp
MRRFKATARLRALGPTPKPIKTRNSFDITRGTDVAKGAAQSRSVAVIGRKRSAQGSWDDACTPGLGQQDLQTKILPRRMTDMLKAFLRDETGAELAEYAVAVALLVAIGLVVYKTLGTSVNTANSTTGSKINTATFP